MTSILTGPLRYWSCARLLSNGLVYHSASFRSRSSASVRVRFAPSPTGDLHLGGLRTALYNYLFAKSHHGAFLLRIEDTDQTRLVPGAMDKLIDLLDWTGLRPDEGPHTGGGYGPYIQSQRLGLYHDKIQVLVNSGVAYRCFCSSKRIELIRKDAMRRGEVPKYDNRCRHLKPSEIEEKLSQNQSYTIRLRLEPTDEPWMDLIHGPIHQNVAMIEGDPILMKSDGYPTYHFACVVDDHEMRISHVLRGEEWMASTAKHVQLHRAFGWTPPEFAHLPLLLNPDGTKLSKRQGDIGVESFRKRGFFPESVLNLLTKAGSGFGGMDTVGMTLEEMIQHFSLENLSPSSGRLQTEFLDSINRAHLKRRLLNNHDDLTNKLEELLKGTTDLGHYSKMNDKERRTFLEKALEWGQARINRVEDLFEPDFRFLWITPVVDVDWLKSLEINQSEVLLRTREKIVDLDSFDQVTLATLLKGIVQESGYKMASFMQVLRMALCGIKQGPPVSEVMDLLGKDEVLKRIKACEKLLDL